MVRVGSGAQSRRGTRRPQRQGSPGAASVRTGICRSLTGCRVRAGVLLTLCWFTLPREAGPASRPPRAARLREVDLQQGGDQCETTCRVPAPHGESVDKTFTCPGLPSEAGMHQIPAPPSPLGPFLAPALPPPSRLCSVPQLEQTFKMQLGTRHPLSQAPGPWHPEEQPSHLCSQHNPSSPAPPSLHCKPAWPQRWLFPRLNTHPRRLLAVHSRPSHHCLGHLPAPPLLRGSALSRAPCPPPRGSMQGEACSLPLWHPQCPNGALLHRYLQNDAYEGVGFKERNPSERALVTVC